MITIFLSILGINILAKLTNKAKSPSMGGSPLTSSKNYLFKIAICEQLDNNFCFKHLKSGDLRAFHSFIDETVGRQLTISEVDKLFLRTRGSVKQEVNGKEVIHYGKDRKPFRVFGYYNSDSYFVITRIDPKHKTN